MANYYSAVIGQVNSRNGQFFIGEMFPDTILSFLGGGLNFQLSSFIYSEILSILF